MPSTKKRINLTVPESIYDKIQVYKEENGLASDATACLQLVVQQLKAQESSKIMMNMLNRLTPEQIKKITDEGWDFYGQLKQQGKLK